MIIVSGSARTGTSLMMQTLLILGYKSPAKPFIKEHEEIKEHNPKGFYELYHEVMDGVQHHNWKGQAVKLFPSCLVYTPKEYISKLIVCKRNIKDATKSYKPIHKILGGELSPKQAYKVSYKYLDLLVQDVPHIFINFEEITTDPERVIRELVEFLNITPSDKQIKEAIKNIDVWHC